ncbi:MAG: SEC-C metal-binding domain-containing protein [Stellaceae bacterium]
MRRHRFDRVRGEAAENSGGIWRSRRVRLGSNESPIRRRGKVGRNDPCPCGSARKIKKCCGQQT